MITKEQLKRARMMALLSQYEASALVGARGGVSHVNDFLIEQAREIGLEII